MAYSDFTLNHVVDRLGVKVNENSELFSKVKNIEVSLHLKSIMEKKSAFSTNSEKARSEKIITPILDDVFSMKEDYFTVFSGENFDVDKDLELKGLADYLICLCNTKFLIQAPIIALAESKRNTPEDGLGQCVAELYAAALFNERKKKPLDKLFGIATNGIEWMFGEYIVSTKQFTYDPQRYSIQILSNIISILTFMRDEALRMDNQQSAILIS